MIAPALVASQVLELAQLLDKAPTTVLDMVDRARTGRGNIDGYDAHQRIARLATRAGITTPAYLDIASSEFPEPGLPR